MPRALADRLRKVEERGWHAAAKSVAYQIHGELFRCQNQIHTAAELASSRFAIFQHVDPRRVVCGTRCVGGQFEDFDFDLKEGTLSVSTESIELEGQYLGSFCITLNFKQEYTSTSPAPYVVQASDPSCPEGRSHITHPHVMNDHFIEEMPPPLCARCDRVA